MIIKGLFRRYEKWNPVHPTYGAFWGIGLGIGCGVGWGPGFGPEVVGYVGAGCGAGFSVGITLLGLGIGLPSNNLFTVPHSAFMIIRQGALDVARARGLLGKRSHAGYGPVSETQRNPLVTFSGLKIDKDLTVVKSMLDVQAKHIINCVQTIGERFFPWSRASPSPSPSSPSYSHFIICFLML
ncbi:hypothetical protein ACJIZ3_001827 [Penstemon smallii]|uniref:Cadmium-induced protein AS8 n=1 Tax=Penstemon smallii TaxID=265156 RepID=A0ABD3U4N6_9LAMI